MGLLGAPRVSVSMAVLACAGCASDPRAPSTTEGARAAASSAVREGALVDGASGCSGSGALPSGVSEHRLTSGGVERRYLVHVPPGVERGRPLSVVLNLHGSGGTPEAQFATSGLAALADRESFV